MENRSIWRKIFAVAVAAASVVLLQTHGIAFWVAQTGSTGVVWSLVLEFAAIYLWLHGRTLPAVLASALLIAGPLHQVSLPLVEQAQEADIATSSRLATEREIEQLERSLARYEENSGKRLGWAERIDSAQERLDVARERLRGITHLQGEHRRDWQKFAIIILEAVALLVVLYSQIFALSQLRLDSKRKTKNRDEEQDENSSATPAVEGFSNDPKIETPLENDIGDRVLTALSLVEERLPNFDGKRQLLAQHLGVRLADLSLLAHHEKRRREGRETISRPALDRIINTLGG
jgi:hypothetical protein